MLDTEHYRDDLVQLGLHKVAHQDETLLDHMFRACAILQDMKAGDHVCMAGLFHGVYGTEGSTTTTSSPSRRTSASRSVRSSDPAWRR
ncbi:DUF6817 domain-containing protein [Streptomyces cirratus]